MSGSWSEVIGLLGRVLRDGQLAHPRLTFAIEIEPASSEGGVIRIRASDLRRTIDAVLLPVQLDNMHVGPKVLIEMAIEEMAKRLREAAA